MPCLELLLLLSLQDPDALEVLRSDRAEERGRATGHLRTLGRAAEPQLRAGSRDADPELAERSRLLLRTLRIRETLPPALLREFPGIENRLAADPGEWASTLQQAAWYGDHGRAHPSLSWSDLNALAPGALKGARDPVEFAMVLDLISNFRLRSAAPLLHELLRSSVPDQRKQAVSVLASLRSPESVAPIARLLDDPDCASDAAWTLARYGRQSATDALLKRIDHPESNVRQACFEVLQTHPPADALALVQRLSRDPEPRLRLTASTHLRTLGDDDAAIFLRLMQDPMPQVRSQAYYHYLNQHGRTPAVVRAARTLLSSPYDDVRVMALQIVGSSGDLSLADDVAELLEDPSVGVRAAAATALRNLHAPDAIPRFVRMLTDPAEEIRWTAFRQLVWMGWPDILPELREKLRDPDEKTRMQAVNLVDRDMPEDLREEVARHIVDPSMLVRIHALRVLGALDLPARAGALVPFLESTEEAESERADASLLSMPSLTAIPGLLQGTSHPDACVRQRCFQVLVQRKSPEAAVLLPRLFDDPDAMVRRSAISAAGELSALAAVPRLRQFLKDPDSETRTAAMYALAQLHARDAAPDLVPLLDEPRTLEQVVRVLWHLRNPETEAALRKVVDSPADPSAGLLALRVLASMKKTGAIPLYRELALKDQHPQRLNALNQLATLHAPDCIPDLIRCLKDPSLIVQDAAAAALAAQGAREAVPDLLELFRRDGDGHRSELIDALARLGAVEAGPRVLDLLRDPDVSVARSAIDAAGRLELRNAIPTLLDLSRGDDYYLRSAAAVALARLGDSREVGAVLEGSVESLFVLNRLRCPDLWARLKATPLLREFRGNLSHPFELLACDTGLELRAVPAFGDNEWNLHGYGSATNALDAIEELSIPAGRVAILEEDAIRMIEPVAARAYWTRWWSREQAR